MNSLRGRSKDRSPRKVTPPGPYMSDNQFADYLADLRNNRVARPVGARPLPSKAATSPREIDRSQTPGPMNSPTSELPPRSMSAMSTRRSQSSLSHYSTTSARKPHEPSPTKLRTPLKPSEVVPTATYIERGSRWMEKEEAVALRDAMDDLDLKKQEEEARIQAAAQKEASELVWQHQHPEAIRPETDGPYRYKEHLRKNSYAKARTASIGPVPGIAPPTGLARDLPRSISVSSSESNTPLRSSSRTPSATRRNPSNGPDSRKSSESTRKSAENRRRSGDVTSPEGDRKLSKTDSYSRRKSSGRRNISGEIKTLFTGDQIWEEPEEVDTDRGRSTEARAVPETAPLKLKAKPNRVSFAQDLPPRPESTPLEREPTKSEPPKRKPFVYSKYISEIQKNEPSQSRNGSYTVNDNSVPTPLPEVPVKDGKEIRSDDIRKATSMRLSDRSPKLPTPTAVSDKPGRPIVSFDKNWTPAEDKVDVKPDSRKPETRAFRGSPSPFDRSRRVGTGSSTSQKSSLSSVQTSKAVENSAVTNVSLPYKAAGEVNGQNSSQESVSSIIHVKPYSAPANVPSNTTTSESKANANAPMISVSEPSNGNTHGSRSTARDIHETQDKDIPTISEPSASNAPEIPISEPSRADKNVPTFSFSEPEESKPTMRAPMISVSEPPSKPTAQNSPTKSDARPLPNTAQTSPTKPSPSGTRPLPDPRTVVSRPLPRTNTPTAPSTRSHWSPALAHPSRATTLCHQCELPTERGAMRVSGQWFHPTCITCFQCNQPLGHLDISAEPTHIRTARLSRIARRKAGEIIEENEGETIACDGFDEKLRFYCHLDWHELFAPRCHHCKTPIESGQDYQTAMGNVYHQGHFFCGECGDPFDEGVPYVKVDGWPWCVNCATKRTERRAPKCRACKKAVVGEYTVALGGEWHLECFRCGVCAEPFGVEGRIFMKKNEESGSEFACCLGCMEKEWKA